MSKKHRNKRLKDVKIEEIKSNIPSFLKSNYVIYIILLAIVGLSFYIRAIIPWDATFANGVTGFAMDDSVYHMRLVENLIANFPNRLTYDAFTFYPYGSVESWGSLFDVIVGTSVIIFGTQNIDVVGALVPTIMGALVVIPVYFIGAEIFNKKAGLFGAFLIAILPGAFLQRSLIGFTDNHVAEVLFSTTFLMFFIMYLNRVKYVPEKLFSINSLKFIINTPLKYSVLSGIFLGLYILTWTSGLIFSAMVAIFIILQIIINHITNKSNSALLLATFIIYGISILMVIPFVDARNSFSVVWYSATHIYAPLIVIVLSTIMVFYSIKIKKNNISNYYALAIISIIFFVSYLSIKIILPDFYQNTLGSVGILFNPHTSGSATIGEAQPTNVGMISSQFGINFILFIVSFILLLYYYIIKRSEKFLLLLIWSTFILYALFAQNRFFYYFTINIAILSGIACGFILDYVGNWKDIKNVNMWNTSSVIIMLFIVGFYPLGSSPYDISTITSKYGVKGEGFYEWHDALTWMRNNTPDPGLDYYGTYERPNPGEKYPYPDTAYGVMSWWDYGHIITYWGHRIPNANPFQSGIGTGIDYPGASPFLTAQTEEEANMILDKLGINGNPGARYVVSNAYMAYSIQPVFAEWDGANTGLFQQIQTSQGTQIVPAAKLYNTMESKLHIFDTSGLKNYRLVHESTPNQGVRGGSEELGYKQVYNVLINPKNPIPMEVSGYVKIFEYVKGANVVGITTPNTEVSVSLKIVTNINRIISYTQKTTSDIHGNYVLTVPYSTTGSIIGQTQFDTKPSGKYTLSVGNKYTLIDVTEDEVLDGKIINISG